jgi:hypothetical protein
VQASIRRYVDGGYAVDFILIYDLGSSHVRPYSCRKCFERHHALLLRSERHFCRLDGRKQEISRPSGLVNARQRKPDDEMLIYLEINKSTMTIDIHGSGSIVRVVTRERAPLNKRKV